MNKFCALIVLSAALVGTLADYAPAAPAKYEAPKATGYGGGHGGYAAPAQASYGGGHSSGGYGGSHGGYAGGHGGSVPVVHTYAAQAPAAKCGANLLVGCAPSVAHVPCVPVHGGSHGGYGAGHGASYGGASYGGASHGASYGGASHGASHGASYGAPASHGGYAAPASHGGYGGHAGYGVPVVHSYAAKAPAAKCGANLLVGCAPSVAHVPCVPVHGGSHGGYGAPAASYGGHGGHGAAAGGYGHAAY